MFLRHRHHHDLNVNGSCYSSGEASECGTKLEDSRARGTGAFQSSRLSGLHSSETCNDLQPLSVHSRARMALSRSEDTRFSLDVLDDAIQNVQPWEPRTFVLPDPAYQGLLQHPKEAGYDQADFQPQP